MYPIHKYNLCRLCLFVGDQLMNIFEENDTIDFVAEEAIEDLLQFKVVKEVGFPWLICSSCLGKLTDFRLFKRRCIECKFTFEQRYENDVEECDALEIRPEELQIKEEEGEDCSDRGDVGHQEEDESSAEEILGDKDDYAAELRNHYRLSCETSEEFMKTEELVDTGRLLGSQGDITTAESIEVNVEEVNVKDDPEVERGNAVGHREVEGSRLRARLMLSDSPVGFGSSVNVMSVEGGREEFMCAVCGEIFLDLDSLKNHLPCLSVKGAGGDVPETILSDYGDRTVDWEQGGENFGYGSVKREAGMQRGMRRGRGPYSGTASRGMGHARGRRVGRAVRGSRLRGVLGRRGVPWPRSQRNAARPDGGKPGETVLPDGLVSDKTVSYQCDICRHGFSRLDMLKKHIHSHSEEGGYACPTCGKSFRTRWSLKNHRKSHQKVTQYECSICGRKFSRQQHLDVHKATHGTGTEYQCHICRKTFPQSSYLQMHLRAHEDDESTQCHICGKRFTRKSVLTVHLRVHMGIKPYECQVCHKRFTQKNNLKHHLQSHQDVKPFLPELDRSGFAENDPSVQQGHPAAQPFQCHLCGTSFERDESLTEHLENHPSSLKYGSDLASGSAASRSLGEHSDLSHLPVSITKVGANPVSHEGTYPGEGCAGDGVVKTSPPDTESESEMGEGSGADPAAGNVPNAGVPSGGGDNPDSDAGGELENSPEASRSGPEDDGVTEHLELGSKDRPHRCQICHKCFAQKEELGEHLKVHSRARPHTCGNCGKRFTEGTNLRKHMILHMDTKPFKCPFCAKSFTLRKNFKRHLELDSCLKRLDLNTSECIGNADESAQGSAAADSGSSWGRQSEATPTKASDTRLDPRFSEAASKNPGSSMKKTLDDIMAAAKEASVEVYLEQEGSVSRVFPCTFCEKTFLRTDQLKKHLMVHGGIKPHACTMCSRRFTEKGNLSKHMKTHAYEKPYPCSYCEKGYTQKKNLERHLLCHQSDQATG